MARKHNPKKLPWFQFNTAAWLGSLDVLKMSVAERGVYVSILAAAWQYGSLPTNPWLMSSLIHCRVETTTRWLQKYYKLVVCVEHGCSEHVVSVESPCSHCVVPKLQEFAETMGKNGGDESLDKNRGNKKRGDDTTPKGKDGEVVEFLDDSSVEFLDDEEGE